MSQERSRAGKYNDDDDQVVINLTHAVKGSQTGRNQNNQSLIVNSTKLFTGTPEEEHSKAHRTYLNELGPGQYNLPPLTGRYSIETKKKNIPLISFGPKTKQPWHPEYHTDFVGRSSPSPTTYSPDHEKKNSRSVDKLGKIGKETKFREPESVTKLRASLPI